MILINGIACLAAAGWLLNTLSHHTDSEPTQNPWMQKFIWLYFVLMTILGVHHVASSFYPLKNDFISQVLMTITPLLDYFHLVGCFMLTMYLRAKNRQALRYTT